jgi:hypothetical protein
MKDSGASREAVNEWIALVPNELGIDAVGLWQVVGPLRTQFGLSGEALATAVRSTVVGLVEAGAMPVQGDSRDLRWHLRTDLASPAEAVVENVMNYLSALGRDPDVGDVWFTRAKFYEEPS